VLAQEILERNEIPQSAVGWIAVDLGKELDCVAQFLPANARLMKVVRRRRGGQSLAFLYQFAMALQNQLRCRQKYRKPG